VITFRAGLRVPTRHPNQEVPMTRIFTALAAPAALALVTACAADTGTPGETDASAGGSLPLPTGPTVGSGGDATGAGGQGAGTGGTGGMTSYATAVGAAYRHGGDARIVLIDATGTRSALFNPGAGTFESADDIDELEGGIPLADVVAAGRLDGETYFVSSTGEVTVFDHGQAAFTTPDDLGEVLEDVPFSSVGAAFGLGSQLFVFNAGGSSYAAYSLANDTWSPVYSFATDFGGGGAPIASVGAAYVDTDDAIVLFDLSGTSYCIYGGNGEFSDDFDIEELGNGSLTFDDGPEED
jgi:hypothetical protein